MDKLLNPDIGLTIWTLVTFACVVFVLGKFAWKPILAALEAREDSLRRERSAAEEARQAAEALKAEYESHLARAQGAVGDLLRKAENDAQARRQDLLKATQDELARLTEKTLRELSEEQRRLVAELRGEVVSLAVDAAEKILGKSVDKTSQDKALSDAAAGLEKWSKGKN